MRGLTQVVPKALIQIAGKTLLERSIECLLEANIHQISIAVGWKSDMIRKAITHHPYLQSLQIIDVPNYEIGPLQTLTTALRSIRGQETIIYPVDLLISSDAISTVISHHDSVNSKVTLAIDREGTSGSDVALDSHGGVLGVQKKLDNAISTAKSAMFMIVSSDFVAFCENSLHQGATTAVSVLNDMIEQGLPIQSSPVSEMWFDADTMADILDANRFLLGRIENQSPGSILIPNGDTMDIGDTIVLDSGIEIGEGVSLTGPCLIRENSKIGKNSHIGPNVSLDLGTEVGSDCEIQNAVIYGQSKIPSRSKVHGIIMYESTQFTMEV